MIYDSFCQMKKMLHQVDKWLDAAVAFAQQSPLKFSRLGVSTYNKTCTEVALGNFRQPILASEGWQSG